MSSRAWPSVRRDPAKKPKKRGPGCPLRDLPEGETYADRKMVCRTCHLVMRDSEPMVVQGSFYHGGNERCPNSGKHFTSDNPQVEPFMRKGRRRALRRAVIRP